MKGIFSIRWMMIITNQLTIKNSNNAQYSAVGISAKKRSNLKRVGLILSCSKFPSIPQLNQFCPEDEQFLSAHSDHSVNLLGILTFAY